MLLICALIHVMYCRYRQGLIFGLDEPMGVCVVVWGAMLPFVLVQALLSVRDHVQDSSISVIGALSPLIVVAVLGGMSCCIGACRQKTSFEVIICNHGCLNIVCGYHLPHIVLQTRRAERMNETAGTAIIFAI